LQRLDSKMPRRCGCAAVRSCNVTQSRYRDATQLNHHSKGLGMKKNLNSSDLAARIAAAANQPAGRSAAPAPVVAPVTAPVLVSSTPASKSAQAAPVTVVAAATPVRSKAKKTKPSEPDTVPITLRPSSALLSKFVLKAAERTREEGRVVSAQQIMIEALERSV
jgi:hypothetical protein